MEIIEGKIKEYRAATAKEFWDLLSPERLLFREPCELLYRGQCDADWHLEPSVVREGNNPAIGFARAPVHSDEQVFSEWVLLDKFIEYCDCIGLSIPNDSPHFRDTYCNRSTNALDLQLVNTSLWPSRELFDLIALAQHYGVPTRLLDWTRRSYVAAYFAASGALSETNHRSNSEKQICVWVLDIHAKARFREFAVVQVPGSNNANVAAQAGVFTLLRQEGTRQTEYKTTALLDEYFSQQPECPLIQVTAPRSAAYEVMQLCEKYGINGATLFPSYYGAARATLDFLHMVADWAATNRFAVGSD